MAELSTEFNVLVEPELRAAALPARGGDQGEAEMLRAAVEHVHRQE